MAKFRKSSKYRTNILGFLLLVFILPLFVFAVYQQIRDRSRAASDPVIPPSFYQSLKLTNTNQSRTAVEIPVSSADSNHFNVWWTIEGWFKPETSSTTNRQQLVSVPLKADGYSIQGTGLYLYNNNLYAEYEMPTTRGVLHAGPITNAWHHIALVDNGKNCYLYVDGVLKTKTTNNECYEGINHPPHFITHNIHLGARLEKRLVGRAYELRREYPFTGQMDELRISSSPVYTANFSPQPFPFAEKTGSWQYRFDSIGAGGTLIPSGTIESTASLTGSNYQSVISAIPYISPTLTSTLTPTHTPTTMPTNTPTITPVPSYCVNTCGNKKCEEITCMGAGCGCAETAATCPSDCKPSPTPLPSGCYYQRVQCVRAPCEPVLICKSPTPTGTYWWRWRR
jgi:hypothetical protein